MTHCFLSNSFGARRSKAEKNNFFSILVRRGRWTFKGRTHSPSYRSAECSKTSQVVERSTWGITTIQEHVQTVFWCFSLQTAFIISILSQSLRGEGPPTGPLGGHPRTAVLQKCMYCFLLDHFDGSQLFSGDRTSQKNLRNGVFRQSTFDTVNFWPQKYHSSYKRWDFMKKSKDMKNCHFIFCLTILIGLKNFQTNSKPLETPRNERFRLRAFQKTKNYWNRPSRKKVTSIQRFVIFFAKKKWQIRMGNEFAL